MVISTGSAALAVPGRTTADKAMARSPTPATVDRRLVRTDFPLDSTNDLRGSIVAHRDPACRARDDGGRHGPDRDGYPTVRVYSVLPVLPVLSVAVTVIL
ncbi:hypothetical protein GCM10010452_41440 [Crossiella cryophila]